METGQKQARSKENALVILATCTNYQEAARQLDITPPTIYQWLQDPEFAAKLEETRSSIVSDAVSKMKGYSIKAVETLAALLDDASSQVKRAAANDILNHVGRLMELKEIEVRLKALENAQQKR